MYYEASLIGSFLLFAVGDERFSASVGNEDWLRCVNSVGFLRKQRTRQRK